MGRERVVLPFRKFNLAFKAIRAGEPSPIGDPLAILPPIVAEFLTWTPPYLNSILLKCGKLEDKGSIRSAIVQAAPMFILCFYILILFSSLHSLKNIKLFKVFNFFVISRLKSVAPATSFAVGLSAYRFASSVIVCGT